MTQALQFLILATASGPSRQQEDSIDYLREENWVLRVHLGSKQIRLTDSQRKLIVKKYDGSARRRWVVLLRERLLRPFVTHYVQHYHRGSRARQAARPTGVDRGSPVDA